MALASPRPVTPKTIWMSAWGSPYFHDIEGEGGLVGSEKGSRSRPLTDHRPTCQRRILAASLPIRRLLFEIKPPLLFEISPPPWSLMNRFPALG